MGEEDTRAEAGFACTNSVCGHPGTTTILPLDAVLYQSLRWRSPESRTIINYYPYVPVRKIRPIAR